ncbi:MAG: hypothetical protein KAU31_02860 [Spirochaetaceae bacterium]|nr:hypothetical protein [Spirochaetaceae bacterium]
MWWERSFTVYGNYRDSPSNSLVRYEAAPFAPKVMVTHWMRELTLPGDLSPPKSRKEFREHFGVPEFLHIPDEWK